MGKRAGYSWISTNVGLFTAAGFVTPSPSATARVRCVLPAPSGPTSATTAPGNKSAPSRRPNASVSERSAISRVRGIRVNADDADFGADRRGLKAEIERDQNSLFCLDPRASASKSASSAFPALLLL